MARAVDQIAVLARGLPRHREVSGSVANLSAAELGHVLDYSDALLCAADTDVFVNLLQSIADWLELDKMLVAYGRDRHDIERARVLSVREQPGWMRLYMRERFYEVDPLVAHAWERAGCFAREPLLRVDAWASGLPRELRGRVRRLAEAATDFRRADHGLAGAIADSGNAKLFYSVVPLDRRQSHESSRLAALLGRLMPFVHAGLALLEIRDPLRIESSVPILSTKERETLALLAEGCNDREIASRLRIVEATVRFHLKRIFAKLGAQNRTHAVSIAHRLGLTSAER